MYKGRKVSLVFPAFNEEENIEEAIAEFKKLKVFDEIIVVDNNSTDSTFQLAKKNKVILLRETKQGFGFTLQKGISKAKGDLIVLSEPDGTFVAKDALRLLSFCSKFQLVLGSRTNPRYIHKDANMGFLIRLGNVCVAKLLQLLYGTSSLSDCGCTFRVFDAKILKKIAPFFTVGASHFLPETVVLAKLANSSIKEISVHYGKRIGTSKITGSLTRAFYVGTRMIYIIFKYKLNGKAKEMVG